jgi:hypothetical protein
MESSPSRTEAAAALSDAEASRARLADRIVMPSWFLTSLGVAIAVQIGTAALGLGDDRVWVLVAGLLLFAVVGGVQLARFRRLNGVWLGGFASRVVLGTATAASTSYALALGFAVWAAFAGLWSLVALCSVAGGAAYALGGRSWLKAYRGDPALHGRGAPAPWLLALAAAAIAGLALLLLGR